MKDFNDGMEVDDDNNNDNGNNNDKKDVIDTGIAMFQIEEYWSKPMTYFFFYSSIPEQYRKYLDESITLLKLRNTLIILGSLEIGSAMLGCSYYFISKNEMHIAINLCAFFLSIAGVAFFSFINDLGIIFYSLLTICIPGLLFIHQIFNYAISTMLIAPSTSDSSSYGMFTLPYLFDMICGFIALLYLRKISETNIAIMRLESLKDEEKHLLGKDNADANANSRRYTRNYLKSEFAKRNALKANQIEEGEINLLCVICCDKPRQVICEPCRHLLLCTNCMNKMSQLKSNSNVNVNAKSDLTCPNCARPIDTFSKIYI